MDTTMHMVTLANGNQVSWDEFSTWSIFKQNGSLFPAVKPGTVKGKYLVTREWDINQSKAFSLAIKKSYSKTRKITRNLGSTNGSAKAVVTPAGQFPSRRSAAEHYCVSSRKMYEWIKSDQFQDFYYLEKNDVSSSQLGNKAVATPAGTFESIGAAARHYSVTSKTIKVWILNKPESGFRYDKQSLTNNLIPGAKPLMTSAGKFPSLKTASDHFDVQEATIKKWILKNKLGFYFL